MILLNEQQQKSVYSLYQAILNGNAVMDETARLSLPWPVAAHDESRIALAAYVTRSIHDSNAILMEDSYISWPRGDDDDDDDDDDDGSGSRRCRIELTDEVISVLLVNAATATGATPFRADFWTLILNRLSDALLDEYKSGQRASPLLGSVYEGNVVATEFFISRLGGLPCPSQVHDCYSAG
jgi:hypothetical protein